MSFALNTLRRVLWASKHHSLFRGIDSLHHQSDAFCQEAYAVVFDEAEDREVEAEIRKEREVENN
ncbi:MAG: hypothetical protein HN442_03505 [Halieaceae bacterium]|jgi:hypothetical protein|nr:hypothetical protein [Halieaceae bacterium]